MANEQLSVQHFVACLAVHWEGTAGPKTKRTLEGVGYHLQMSPGMEPPFEIGELWFYARMYRTGSSTGNRRFRIVIRRLYYGNRNLHLIFDLGNVQVSKPDGVIEVAWPIRTVIFPVAGLYEFRLQSRIRTEIGRKWKTLSTEHLHVEEQR